VELLLNISQGGGGKNDAIQSSHIDLACSLGHISIAYTLHRGMNNTSESSSVDRAADVDVCPPRRARASASTDSPASSSVGGDSEFSDLGLLPPFPHIASTGGDTKPVSSDTWPGVTGRCEIDVIESPTDISPQEFVERYVLRRRPVALRGFIDAGTRKKDTQYV
jgi:hypothetical protein